MELQLALRRVEQAERALERLRREAASEEDEAQLRLRVSIARQECRRLGLKPPEAEPAERPLPREPARIEGLYRDEIAAALTHAADLEAEIDLHCSRVARILALHDELGACEAVIARREQHVALREGRERWLSRNRTLLIILAVDFIVSVVFTLLLVRPWE